MGTERDLTEGMTELLEDLRLQGKKGIPAKKRGFMWAVKQTGGRGGAKIGVAGKRSTKGYVAGIGGRESGGVC